MTMLSGHNPLGKLPVKRPFDYGGTGGSYFPANFKRPKVEAGRDFPKGCGAICSQFASNAHELLLRKESGQRFKVRKVQVERQFPKACGARVLPFHLKKIIYGEENNVMSEVQKADSMQQGVSDCRELPPRVSTTQSKVVSSEEAFPTSIVQGEGALAHLLSRDNVTAIGGAVKVSDDRSVVSKRSDKSKMVNAHREPVHATGSSCRAISNMYPPPKIRKGFSAFRQFPPRHGPLDCASESEDQLEASDEEEMEEEFKGTQVTCEGKCTEYEVRIHPDVKVVEDIMDHDSVYPSGIILSPDSAPQIIAAKTGATMVGKPEKRSEEFSNHIGAEEGSGAAMVGKTAKLGEEFSNHMVAEEGSGTAMSSPGAEFSDTKADHGGLPSTMLKRKRVFDGERAEATCQNPVACDLSTSDFIFLQKQHVTEASKRNDVKADSLIMSTEDAENSYDRHIIDGDEKELDQHICAQGASYDDNIVPYDVNIMTSDRQKVREARNLFKEIFVKLSEEDVPRLQEKKKPVRLVHIEAAMILKRQQKWVNSDRLIGPVPGIEVGDRFRYRAELVVVGLHHQFQAGIDYMMKDGTIFATSIVDSGRYANAAESSDVLVYSGVGGNPSLVANHKPDDQKLERGNLALKNSMDKGIPVRVIRGRQNTKALNSNDIYMYDGLYHVTSCKQEKGQYGKLVFMFQLNRLPGQPKLVRETSSLSEMSKPSTVVEPVVHDISDGKERMPIRAINTVDGEKPFPFYYLTKMLYLGRKKHSLPIGCDCTNGCSDSEPCLCTLKNGGEIPFNDDGAIIGIKPLIHECGPLCKCPPSCKNRVSQNGIRYQLEIFKTKTHGWGVRSQSYIPIGSFICEYVGELLGEKEAERRHNDEYLFDVGCDRENVEDLGGDAYTIDAAYCGNVGRFFNHSCSPNIYAQNVLYDHNEKRFPHVMFFAVEDIPPLQELTYDYNYKLDQVRDDDGNIKRKHCFCGSSECVGRMY